MKYVPHSDDAPTDEPRCGGGLEEITQRCSTPCGECRASRRIRASSRRARSFSFLHSRTFLARQIVADIARHRISRFSGYTTRLDRAGSRLRFSAPLPALVPCRRRYQGSRFAQPRARTMVNDAVSTGGDTNCPGWRSCAKCRKRADRGCACQMCASPTASRASLRE
jgi:hypothetical protein